MTTKPKVLRKLVCSICKQTIEPSPLSGWAGGNNAEPINSGRCCDACDSQYVIPARLVEFYRNQPPKKGD